MVNQRARILIVDDEEINRALLEMALTAHGHIVTVAGDGEMAWQLLNRDSEGFELLLLDRMMPGLDGISLLRRIRSDHKLRDIPVIIQTSLGEPEHFIEGFQAGANGYLAKPLNLGVLTGMINTTLQIDRERQLIKTMATTQQRIMQLATRAVFRFQSIGEARALAIMLGQLCPSPGSATTGLVEIFINSIEHGNLAIDFEEKGRLLALGNWEAEIEFRSQLPQYRQRFAELRFSRDLQGIYLEVTDQGEGFDWRRFLDFDPERVFDLHGRGIAAARTFYLDEVTYLGKGNRVRIFMRVPPTGWLVINSAED